MIDLEKMASDARRRVREHVNRSAAQHKRALHRGFAAAIDARRLVSDPRGLKLRKVRNDNN
jgi:hypothetical protein